MGVLSSRGVAAARLSPELSLPPSLLFSPMPLGLCTGSLEEAGEAQKGRAGTPAGSCPGALWNSELVWR